MRNDRGFTLTELMVAVIIAAILASVGTVVYSGHRRRMMAMEAQVNLGLLASSQEAYRAEFGVYANVDCWNPGAIPCGTRDDFTNPGGAGCAAGCCLQFRQLGFRPENPWVAFRYQADGGTDTIGAVPGWASTFILAGTEAQGWFALQAIGDLICGDTSETTYGMVDRRSDLVVRDYEFH